MTYASKSLSFFIYATLGEFLTPTLIESFIRPMMASLSYHMAVSSTGKSSLIQRVNEVQSITSKSPSPGEMTNTKFITASSYGRCSDSNVPGMSLKRKGSLTPVEEIKVS